MLSFVVVLLRCEYKSSSARRVGVRKCRVFPILFCVSLPRACPTRPFDFNYNSLRQRRELWLINSIAAAAYPLLVAELLQRTAPAPLRRRTRMPAPFPKNPHCVLVPTARFATLERRGRVAKCTWDTLTPDWKIAQLKEGHRFSNDDALCGFFAAEGALCANKLLDLGSGLGSVGLTALLRVASTASLTCVEAQSLSHDLCRRTVAKNNLESRVKLVLSDLRTFDGEHAFDLVTGSPPYFPPAQAVGSPHDQRAFCRLEFRGGLDDYCACAEKALAPGGTFAFVMAAQDERCVSAPLAYGFGLLRRVDVVFKAGRKPHVCVCVLARLGDARLAAEPVYETLVLRDAEGRRTRAYRVWQERSQLPAAVPAARVAAALDGLVAATDRAALAAAIADAEALGLRADPGSEELVRAKAALGGGLCKRVSVVLKSDRCRRNLDGPSWSEGSRTLCALGFWDSWRWWWHRYRCVRRRAPSKMSAQG